MEKDTINDNIIVSSEHELSMPEKETNPLSEIPIGEIVSLEDLNTILPSILNLFGNLSESEKIKQENDGKRIQAGIDHGIQEIKLREIDFESQKISQSFYFKMDITSKIYSIISIACIFILLLILKKIDILSKDTVQTAFLIVGTIFISGRGSDFIKHLLKKDNPIS